MGLLLEAFVGCLSCEGAVGSIVVVVVLPLLESVVEEIDVVDEFGPYEARDVNELALLIAWSLFAFSIAHLVWPLRWTRRA